MQNPTPSPCDSEDLVFISYSHEDQVFVHKLAQELQAYGVPVWVDKSDIKLQQTWFFSIEEALKKTTVFLLIVSPNSLGSLNVNNEIMTFLNLSAENNKKILPIKIKDCDMPAYIAHIQHIDFSKRGSYDGKFPELLSRLPKHKLVFINYSQAPEDKEFVERIVKDLLDRSVPIWIDYASISPTEIRNIAIESARKRSSHFLSILSEQSSTSIAFSNHLASALTDLKKDKNKNLILIKARDYGTILNLGDRDIIDFSGDEYYKGLAKLMAILPRCDGISTEVDELIAEFHDSTTTHRQRQEIGRKLNALHDTRKGLGFISKEARSGKGEYIELPSFVWCPIPQQELSLEHSNKPFKPLATHISKYPITNKQFQAFLNVSLKSDGSIMDKNWWEGLPIPDDYLKNLKQITAGLDNYPRVEISWYDALAFCRWLNAKEFGLDSPLNDLLHEKWIYRLPTDWEWVAAATHGDPGKYPYPWGRDADSSRANTKESNLGEVVAVGLYPQGNTKGGSEDGVVDMVGNIWEWCLNSEDQHDPRDIKFPPDQNIFLPVVRGGSRDTNIADAKYNKYLPMSPELRFNIVGFRLVKTKLP